MQEIPDTRTLAFDTRSLPLAGKRVLITRTREQASTLNERLRSAGASCVEFPTIQIVPPQDWSELDAALRRLYAPREESYDWLILTSTNGVSIFFDRLVQLGYSSEDLQAKQHVRIATVGSATVAALERYHIRADLVPEEYVSEGIIAALLRDAEQRGTSLVGQRILLARVARPSSSSRATTREQVLWLTMLLRTTHSLLLLMILRDRRFYSYCVTANLI